MSIINEMRVDFLSVPENEAFARLLISAFLLPINPTLSEMSDVKTAVSEAVTNAIIHGYGKRLGFVRMRASLSEEGYLSIDITDNGKGIEDLHQAMQPFWTSVDGFERSGMGFTVMESFMDSIDVISKTGEGTTVRMYKQITSSARCAKEA
ncbi:MAG: anti-sigma F factor [Clostridia bacterium]|nr:anti-sigma F factor [Clostridia bacterium]MBQ4156799.1 anti-sigma F factor [Clostridia bacterium]